MKNIPAVSVYVILLLFISHAAARADEDIPIHVQKLSDRAIVLKVADNPGGTNVTAIASEKGLVVIDTEMSFTIAAEIKKTIEKEFGRKDFAYRRGSRRGEVVGDIRESPRWRKCSRENRTGP